MPRFNSLCRAVVIGSVVILAGCAGPSNGVTAQGQGGELTASVVGGGPVSIIPVGAKPDTTSSGDGFAMALGMYFF